MKSVIILSGCSGSGKSHHAAQLVENESGLSRICSADYFFMSGDKYTFDPSRLGEVHSQCFRLFLSYMKKDSGIDLIVVDNTNTTPVEIAPYMLAAEAFGYAPEIITFFPPGVGVIAAHVYAEKCAARNTHGVPLLTIRRQLENIYNFQLPGWWKNSNVARDF